MEPLKSVGERYWAVYYLVYVAGVGLGIWRYRPFSQAGSDELYSLVAVFALAAGAALLIAIIVEVIGRMVLLIPAEIKRLKEEGRKEGRREGRREERQRIVEALRQIGEREDGTVQITLTPELFKLLMGDHLNS